MRKMGVVVALLLLLPSSSRGCMQTIPTSSVTSDPCSSSVCPASSRPVDSSTPLSAAAQTALLPYLDEGATGLTTVSTVASSVVVDSCYSITVTCTSSTAAVVALTSEPPNQDGFYGHIYCFSPLSSGGTCSATFRCNNGVWTGTNMNFYPSVGGASEVVTGLHCITGN